MRVTCIGLLVCSVTGLISLVPDAQAASFATRNFKMKPIHVGRQFNTVGAKKTQYTFLGNPRRVGQEFQNVGRTQSANLRGQSRYLTSTRAREFELRNGFVGTKPRFNPAQTAPFNARTFNQTALKNRYMSTTNPSIAYW